MSLSNTPFNNIKAAVVGASGYSGMELVRLLTAHPAVGQTLLYSSPQKAHAGAKSSAGALLSGVEPDFLYRTKSQGPVKPFDDEEIRTSAPDVIFFATPNEVSNELIPRYRNEPFKMIDLSGGFRLKAATLYPQWYGFSHAAPEMLGGFTYGLPELNGPAIAASKWVANPGCYATSAILPLLPLTNGGLIDHSAPVVCDAKSGVSGAGKQPNASTHFCEVSESFRAYSVFSHRHLPEIEQTLQWNGHHKLMFTPHLIPINRGILSTLYLKLRNLMTEEELRHKMADFYKGAPFVRVFPAGELPQVKWVSHTNDCHIGVRVEPSSPWVVLVSCIDNLVKGAAGQAVQNMNLMFGLDERTGLA